MSLKYSFRHLFYGGKVQKKRLYNILKDLDARLEDLEDDDSSDSGSESG